MSQENVQIVQQFYESVTRQDLDGVLDCVHAEIELDWSASRSPWRGIYKGYDGLMRFWTEQIEGWKEFSLELAEAIEYDRERVLAVTVMRGRGEGSGISTKAAGATLWTFRDGRILSGRLFQTKEEALEAVGLSDQDAHADS
jgi:ketosteroid isomerase-like protein